MAGHNDYRFPAGTVIVQEGSLDLRAYKILSGRVEVYKTVDGKRLRRRIMEQGQVFGEIGLLLETPRTASVMTLEDTEVRAYDADTFGQLLRDDLDEALPVLKSLFEVFRRASMKALDADVAREVQPAPGMPMGTGPSAPSRATKAPATLPNGPLSMTALTARAKEGMKKWGQRIEIQKFPFKIGRSTGMMADILSDNNLSLEDRKPWTVSRNHCSIDLHPGRGGYIVCDRGSTLGTIVNGEKIGAEGSHSEAPLDQKVNQVILGREKGGWTFEFRID